MRRKRFIPIGGGGVNITSLCDVMLSLLIFFMLVSKKGMDTGADLKIVLPQTVMGSPIPDFGNTVTLNIYQGPAGEPKITTLDPRSSERMPIALREMAGDGIREPLKEFLGVLRASNEQFKVIIRAEEDLDYQSIEPVLLACAAANVQTIHFATRRSEGSIE